jgi:hypothetical protein
MQGFQVSTVVDRIRADNEADMSIDERIGEFTTLAGPFQR